MILPPTLASLGSPELFLLELQGDLEAFGDTRGQTVGQLKIDQDGKVAHLALYSQVDIFLTRISVLMLT